MSLNPFYITTPIYYVNDIPHIGHAYTTILADVLARYQRLMGRPTFFLTGTDEHGLKVQQAAEKSGLTPQGHADKTVVRFQELWEKLEITHDDFVRTTQERHTVVVQRILQDLYDRDEIYRAEYDGWYDVSSETFITETELKERGGPENNPTVQPVKESNYFFRMSKYQEWLIQYIEENPAFIQPDFRRNETLGFLKNELKDLCISRPKKRLSWGIELPFDHEFVTYVWFDALVNYISTIGYSEDEHRFNNWWPASCHLIGKDILTTHTVYWPTMLKAIGLPMPQTIFAHGWWLYGDRKMSKSEGNVVNPLDVINQFGVDPLRYFLIAEMTLGHDARFTEEIFIKRYHADLSNDLGNLLSRLSNMIHKYCNGNLPNPDMNPEKDEENDLWDAVQKAVDQMKSSLVDMRLDNGLHEVMTAIRSTNKYLERKQPWTQAKNDDQKPLHQTLYTGVEALRVCASLLVPVMPGKMGELLSAIGQSVEPLNLDDLKKFGVIVSGQEIKITEPLFPRVELRKKKETTGSERSTAEDEMITYEQFSQIKLKTAKVLEAEKVPETDKLMRLQVEVGEEKRQLVAGVAEYYQPDDLIGKNVIIVSNLKPAKIRGVESEGMLLVAHGDDGLKLITVDGDVSSGVGVK